MNGDILFRIGEILSKNQSGVILLPSNASLDAAAAATALYLSLNIGAKNVGLACENAHLKYDLIGINKIHDELVTTGENLVISFPYADGAVDKVDYNIQGDSFNLVVTPRPNFPKLDPEKVKFSYIGGLINFMIVIDSPNLNNLGQIYQDNKEQFQGKEIINIDRHLTNANYGSINYLNKSASSISEMVYQLLKENRLAMDKDIASNLYYGIAAATNNFTSYSTNADTFSAIAELLRAGAIKKQYRKETGTSGFAKPQLSGSINKEIQKQKPMEKVEKETNPDASDWLKPKIFNSEDLI